MLADRELPTIRRRTGSIPVSFRLPLVVRNVVRRWRKTIGATIGVGLALGVVVALLGLVAGVLDLATGEYRRSSIDLYAVSHGGVIVPILPGDNPGTVSNAQALINQLRASPGVNHVLATTSRSLPREKGRDAWGKLQTEPWEIIGLLGDPREVDGMLNLREGRWLRAGPEIVLAPRLADIKELGVGDTVTLAGRRLRIVGIGVVRGTGYGTIGSAFLDYQTLRELSPLTDRVELLLVDTDQPATTAALMGELRDLDIADREEVITQVLEITSHDIVTAYLFSFLGLVIAGLFVGNMLTNSVNERRGEIATLRAIGVPRRLILGIVTGEALFIVAIAYLIGCGIGTVLAHGMNAIYSPLVKIENIVSLEPVLYLQVLGVSLVLGLVSSLFPGSTATRIQPAEALREA